MLCKEVTICSVLEQLFFKHGQLVKKVVLNECEIFLGMLATLLLNHYKKKFNKNTGYGG
jgi:hypothetical protein